MGIFSTKHDNPKYSLITVNYQSASALGRMLRSLPSDYFLNGEVIIVNNDGTEAGLLSRMFQSRERVRILESKSNIGFSSACNRGAWDAEGEILLFLNPDTRLISGSLIPWLEDVSGNENVIIAPSLLQNGHDEAWSSGRTISPWQILFQNILPVSKIWFLLSRESLGWVSGAAFAIRRTDFRDLGGFDESFFLYYEDVDLCRRAKEEGFSIRLNKRVSFSHSGGRSHNTGRDAQKQAYFASQDAYVKKYYGTGWSSLLRSLRLFRLFFRRTLC